MPFGAVNTRNFTDKLAPMTETLTWPQILAQLLEKRDLTRAQASWAMRQIMSGETAESQVGAFMLALRSKGESVEELAGLVDTMLEHAVLLNTGNDALDIVGTGGDLVGTVNVSSMAAILAAAMGIPVMKHGSRSASGKRQATTVLPQHTSPPSCWLRPVWFGWLALLQRLTAVRLSRLLSALGCLLPQCSLQRVHKRTLPFRSVCCSTQ